MTPTELLDGFTQMAKRLEDAEAEVVRLKSENARLAVDLATEKEHAKREVARTDTAERQAKDFKATLNMYAKAWTRELGPYIMGKAHEIDALVGGTRNLRERYESAIAQGQADHRALHDALEWAHEWHGKKLPPPSRAVIEILAKVPGHPSAAGTSAECGDTQSTSSFGPVRCRLPPGHEGAHVDNVTAASTLPGARTCWPRK